MTRIDLIQRIIQKGGFQNYLEVGCRTGNSFLPIKAKNKIAVDPSFKISIIKKWVWLVVEPTNRHNKYYKEESDVFFQKRKEKLKELGWLDVVLIDGLHTFTNSLRDVLNSLQYLNQNGFIIMHDCFPPHEAAALPTNNFPSEEEQKQVKGWTGEWCGDVWKTIVYLQACFGEFLSVCVINTDYGLGVIQFKPHIERKRLNLTIDKNLFEKINKITYKEMAQDVETVLNLKLTGYINRILRDITHNKNTSVPPTT